MTVSIEIPTIEPAAIVAGDTITWKKYLSEHLPADGWALTYYFVKDGNQIVIAATTDGDSHLVEVAATTSANYTAGAYEYHAIVKKAATGERYKVLSGKIEVLPDFEAQTEGYDARTFTKKMVDELEAILPLLAAKKAASFSIGGRSYSYKTWEEGNNAYKFWVARLAAEERRAGRKGSNTIYKGLR